MPTIELPELDDKKLRDIAPDYLQGDRNHASRVRWLIDEYIKLRNGTQTETLPDGGDVQA